VAKNKRPLGMVGRNVNRRWSHKRICRNAKLMPIQVEVYIHAGSLHEAKIDVNQKQMTRTVDQTMRV